MPHCGPNPSTHLSLHRKFPVLGEAEGEAAEDTGKGGGEAVSRPQVGSAHTPLTQGHRAGSSPELTLDLDPAGAAQEGPGLVPLLHGRQAGAEHFQPQVQHLLTGTGEEVRLLGSLTTGGFCPSVLGWATSPFPATLRPPQVTPVPLLSVPHSGSPTLGDTHTRGPMASTPLSPVTALSTSETATTSCRAQGPLPWSIQE